MKTIADLWKEFEVGAIAGCSEEKRQEMRASFYLGAQAMMFLLHNIINERPPAGVAHELNKLRDEIAQYARDFGLGKK